MTPITNSNPCGHSRLDHFFRPGCKHQSTLGKVAALAFHAFTLLIPFFIYHGIAFLRATFCVRKKEISPYSDVENEALKFARSLLTPEIQPTKLQVNQSPYWQPINPEIALLRTVYLAASDKLDGLLEGNQENPWEKPEVIQATDDFLKIAYSISVLTLEDLENFTNALAKTGIKRTFAEALTLQDSYQFRTFYSLTFNYHFIRGGMEWMQENPRLQDGIRVTGNEGPGIYAPLKVPKAFADSFYREGTTQNKWRSLYNAYCNRVPEYVDLKELREKDNRHVNWIPLDVEPAKFHYTRGSLPT